jgi:hypothetical protein
MELLDPATGTALPNDAIQRILFVANAVHVYNIPPLTSTKGYSASTWTAEPQRHIFTARLRVVETAYESTSSTNQLKVDAVLEDASTGQLFAAAPYTAPGVVEPVLDSSRFFALTVRDPQGRKAILGIGFEERSEAFDLSIALQEARKALGWEGEQSKPAATKEQEEHKDYSLKEGETITVSSRVKVWKEETAGQFGHKFRSSRRRSSIFCTSTTACRAFWGVLVSTSAKRQRCKATEAIS